MTQRSAVTVLVCLSLAFSPALAETTLVEFGGSMRYVDNSSDPGTGLTWTTREFDDDAWAPGTYGIGYDTGSGAQDLLQTAAPVGSYSVYTRATFTIPDVSSVNNLLFGVDYDDGYVAWINGVEVARSGSMPSGAPSWNTDSSSHESSNGSSPNYGALLDISATAIPELQNGDNILAVGVWNRNAPSSSDLVLVPKLVINKTVGLSRGPYLQMGTPYSVIVRWRTDLPTDSRVRFGEEVGNLTMTESDPTLTTEHVVKLTGLTPDTRQHYAVGTSSGDLAGDDADHFFVTSPLPGLAKPTRIWALGDSGTANADARAVRDAYYGFTGSRHTDLWLLLGDNAYPDGTDSEYQAAVFDIYPEMLRKSVVWTTLGNHDGHSADSATESGPYYDMFSLPSGAEAGGVISGTEAYYSFDYGNIHFVCLDSYESNRASNGAMMTWLAQDVLDTVQDWIVAFWNHPPYTKGSHDSDTESRLAEMRQNANPVLEANGVDLILSGHSHSYERSFLIDGHYGGSSTFSESHQIDSGDGDTAGDGPYLKPMIGPDPHEGTVYSVAGSSGKISGGSLDHPAMVVALNLLGSLVIDVNGNRMDVTFLDDAGSIRDSFTLVKDSSITPLADFSAEPVSGTAPLSVAFTDRTLNGPTSWSWDFDDGPSVDADLQNPVHLFADPGRYDISLAATNLSGVDQTIKADYVCVGSPDTLSPVVGVQFQSDGESMPWLPHTLGARYDVVKGELAQLRSSGGDFGSSVSNCLVEDGAVPQAADSSTPPVGDGYYYVVRAVGCAGMPGTYDATSPAQVATRDPGIDGSLSSCP